MTKKKAIHPNNANHVVNRANVALIRTALHMIEGMTVRDAAERLGDMSYQTVFRWRQGKSKTLSAKNRALLEAALRLKGTR